MVLVVEKRRLEGNQDVLEYGEGRTHTMREGAADPSTGVRRWVAKHTFAGIGVFGYYFEAGIHGKSYVYENNRDVLHWTKEAGSNGLGLVAEKPESTQAIRRYRLTVHRADYTVPDWAADAIYYYIFPERFRNGDPGNDTKPGVDRYQTCRSSFTSNGPTSLTSRAAATVPMPSTATISSAATSPASSKSWITSPISAPTRFT